MTTNSWARLALITVSVGGGFAGFAAALHSLFHLPNPSVLNIMLTLFFMGLYGFVTASGLAFVHDPRRTGPLTVAFAIQVPAISSSVIVYKFAAGLVALIGVGGSEEQTAASLHLNWEMGLGGTYRISFMHDILWVSGSTLPHWRS